MVTGLFIQTLKNGKITVLGQDIGFNINQNQK